MKKINYCIIGSGIGGASLALKLAEKEESNILVIEAGGKRGNSNNVKYENVGLPFKLRATTSIQLGGTSNLWHGVLSILDEIDFQKRHWIPNSGWPIKQNDLSPFYKEASNIFKVDNYDFFYENKLSRELKLKLTEMSFNRDYIKNKIFQQPLPILRFKKLLKKKSNIQILSNTTALELIFSSNKKKVERLIVGRQDGSKQEIIAEKFIVCAGALETPRLLLNSKGIKNSNIGKYLMDHPMGNLCQLQFNKPQRAHIYSDMKYTPITKIKTGLIFSEKVQEEYKLPNHNFYMRPSFKRGIDNESEKTKLALLTFLSGKINIKDILKLISNFNLVLQILAYKFTLNIKYKFSDLLFITEQIPNSNSTVTLSNIKDKWGYPIAKINWQLKKEDKNSLLTCFKLLKQAVFSNNDYKFTHEEKDLDWENTFTSAAHHVGTARMSYDAKNGVVDKNLKVFDIDNLFICDGSVFPTSGNVNSGFTIVALAYKLAKHLNNG